MASTRPEPHRAAIYSTAFTAFFAIAGIAVVDPILPVIGAEIGASTWQIELLFTAYIAVMALGMIPAVIATGRFGYKAVLSTGVSVVAVAAILASLSTGIGQLAALRGLWGLGNAMFFATAMVLLISLANDREWAVELFETCLGLGFAERGRAAENGEARRRRGIALQPAREFLSRLGVASELIPEPRAQRGRAATQVDEEAHGRALFRIREQALEEVTMTRGVHGWAKR